MAFEVTVRIRVDGESAEVASMEGFETDIEDFMFELYGVQAYAAVIENEEV